MQDFKLQKFPLVYWHDSFVQSKFLPISYTNSVPRKHNTGSLSEELAFSNHYGINSVNQWQ